MDHAAALRILQDMLVLVLVLSAPVLLASLVVGLLVSVFQASTQIQDPTLTVVPKLLAVFVVLALTGPWLLSQLVLFAQRLYTLIARVGG